MYIIKHGFTSTDKICITLWSRKFAGKWSEENNGKKLSWSYWLYLSNGCALIFFYVYQSSHLISHGHRAIELVSSDCSRAELSSWIFPYTREPT